MEPAADRDARISQSVEDLPVQQLVPELAVEAIVAIILPWRSGFDLERLHTDPTQPVAHSMGGKVRAAVPAEMIGQTMAPEQPGERRRHIVASEAALDMDCEEPGAASLMTVLFQVLDKRLSFRRDMLNALR